MMVVMAVTVIMVMAVMVLVVMIVMVLDMNILDSHMASLNFICLFDTCCIPGSNTPLTSLSRNSPPLSTVFFCCVWVCAALSLLTMVNKATLKSFQEINFQVLQCGAPKIAKLVYNSNNYGLWYL